MQVKGMRPISIEQIPDDNTMIQIAFRKGDTIHNINLIGPTIPIVASSKARGIVFMNFIAAYLANASKAHGIGIDGPVDAPPAEMLRDAKVDDFVSLKTELGGYENSGWGKIIKPR